MKRYYVDDFEDFIDEVVDELESEANYGLSLPCVYGRWCGPLCGGGGPPIDDVDACCQVHDNCYGRRGYFACSCDRNLVRCLRPKRNLRTPKGRAAHAISAYFRQAPCRA